MMKKILLIALVFQSCISQAQFTTTDQARAYNNLYIRNSVITAFTNLRLNTALNGLTRLIDTALNRQPTSYSFLTSDFNVSNNAVSLDYANMRDATSVQKGLLTPTTFNIFNAKQAAMSGVGLARFNGSSVTYDNTTYTALQRFLDSISAVRAAISAGGSTPWANVTGSNAGVLASVLTGFTSTTGTVTSADDILTAIRKLAGNALAAPTTSTIRSIVGDSLNKFRQDSTSLNFGDWLEFDLSDSTLNVNKDSIEAAITRLGGGGAGSGTVNTGTGNRLAYYPSSGTSVDDLPAITANRALVSDANGLPAQSIVSVTELNYLSGVTSGVQAQLNQKASLTSPSFSGTPTAPTASTNNSSTQIANTEFVHNVTTALAAETEGITVLEATTSDDTPYNIDTIPITNGENIRVEVIAQGELASGDASYSGKKVRKYHINSTGTLAAGTLTTTEADERLGTGLSSATFTITNTGTYVIIQLTGEAGKDILWKVTHSVTRVNAPL